MLFVINIIVCKVRVITKLPSNLPKGKAKLISQQPENRNGPDLVQAFPKKWWVESEFMAPNLSLPLRLKVPVVAIKKDIYIYDFYCTIYN
jgi:hypothetical protein